MQRITKVSKENPSYVNDLIRFLPVIIKDNPAYIIAISKTDYDTYDLDILNNNTGEFLSFDLEQNQSAIHWIIYINDIINKFNKYLKQIKKGIKI